MLNKLPSTTSPRKKRIGRGIGSGKGGHTVGRGAKGQKAKRTMPLLFEGTKTKKSLLKRLPLLRGKGKFKGQSLKPIIVNLKYLSLFDSGEEITLEALAKKSIINQKEGDKYGVKILGEGELKISLKVKLPCSKGAEKKIKKAGGEVIKK